VSAPPATHHRFTRDEYRWMGRTGILLPTDRVELIDGEIIDLAPIGPRHLAAVNMTNRLFVTSIPLDRAIVSIQNPLALDEHNEPVPDLAMLVPRADEYSDGLPTGRDVLLIVEVGDSTIAFDRTAKAAMYAAAGVVEYWVVNVPDDLVLVHREPGPAGYARVISLSRGDAISPLALPDVSIAANRLLP
jgi:Uma2 family endonuclease